MSTFHRFQIGQFTCVALYDNSRETTLAQTFPGVPVEALEAAAQQEGFDAPQITVGYNCLLVDSGEKRVLVDTGSGQGQLLQNLAQAGYKPAAIDAIILTHGDGDHIGGIASFPNVQFIMWQGAWELWTDDARRQAMVAEFIDLFRASAPADRLAKMAKQREEYGRSTLPALQDRIDRVALETTFLPGLKLVGAPGHRRDHIAVEVKSAGETLLHVVDSIRHPLQASHPTWTSFIDSDPEETAVTNQKLLDRAAQQNALVFGAHLPFPGLGRVRTTPAGWTWVHI